MPCGGQKCNQDSAAIWNDRPHVQPTPRPVPVAAPAELPRPHAHPIYTTPPVVDPNPFAAAFDFSFETYATPGLVKIVYGLMVAVTALAIWSL